MTKGLRPTWLEIDLSAVAHNARLLRARAQQGARVMAVVKADAYGHGAEAVANVALQNGAQALGVAIPEEGIALRRAGIAAPILVLGGIAPEAARDIVRHGLAQTVYDEATLRLLAKAAESEGRPAAIHIKVDSGMGRIGVRNAKALLALAERALAEPGIVLEGVYTHFATADAQDTAYREAQHARFTEAVAALRHSCPGVVVHAANSAALLCAPHTHHGMVRAGIALYLDPQFPGGASDGLRQAMRWVTRAVHAKEIAPGESVGYGCHFTASRQTRVMTLPVGYADGYHRCIGGRGYALVRGQRAPVIGRVCMDQAMLDVTDIPGAGVGDEVVLLGAQGDDAVSVREMGIWCGLIDYEVVLSPTGRVPKVHIS